MADQLILYGLLLATVALGALIVRQLWRKLDARSAQLPVLLVLLAVGWAGGYLLELTAPTIAAKTIWAKVQYLPIAFLPIAWFAFALRLAHLRWYPVRRMFVALAVLPVVTQFLVWSNDWHGLIWRSRSLRPEGQLVMLELEYGPAFWVINGYSLILVAAGCALLLFRPGRWWAGERLPRSLLSVAGLLPAAANVLYTTRAGPLPFLDLTPFAFLLSAVLFSWLLLRYRFDRVALSQLLGEPDQRLQLALHAASADSFHWDASRTDYAVDDRELDLFGGRRANVRVSLEDLRNLVHPDDAQHFESTYANAMKNLDLLETDCRVIDHRGETRHVRLYGTLHRDRRGSVVQVSGLVRDITDDVRAEAMLLSSRERLEAEVAARTQELQSASKRVSALLNSTAEGIIGVDSNHRISLCNAAALDIFGIDRESDIAGRMLDSLLELMPQRAREAIESTLVHRVPGNVSRARLQRPDGEIRHVDLYSFPIVGDDAPEGAVLTFLDVSETVEARRWQIANRSAHRATSKHRRRRCGHSTMTGASR